MSTYSATSANLYHDPLDSFTDREQILELYEQFLAAASTDQLHLLTIKGNSGTGKTFLISYLRKHICPRLGWHSGLLSFSQSTPDFRFILTGLEGCLRGCVPQRSLQQYRTQCREYNRHFDEYRASITVYQSVEAYYYSSVSNVNQKVQINTQLRERELQLRSELSRALIELFEENEHPLCLFIDGYERLAESDTDLVGWFWEALLPGLAQGTSHPFVVITCGWEWPNNASIKPLSYPAVLADFNQTQVRSYLEKQGLITAADIEATPSEEELIAAFYELTKGHPLVSGLAVLYLNQLSSNERTAQHLQAAVPLVDERARVEFLEERLLSRLSEPYRTLLEQGPILRSFDQEVLNALLAGEANGNISLIKSLDDRTYDRFLHYPFINHVGTPISDPLQVHLSFHELVRRVGLSALRRHHPQTKEQLHRRIAEYYRRLTNTEWTRSTRRRDRGGMHSENDPSGVLEKEFKTEVEYLYHSLQVEEFQFNAFEEWNSLVIWAIDGWHRPQLGSLLEIIQQLVEENEPFLSKDSVYYAQYLVSYARFLDQGIHWQEALVALEEAKKICGRVGNFSGLGTCLGSMGAIYSEHGELMLALSLSEQALIFCEKHGDSVGIISCLNNIGQIYCSQQKWEQASNYLRQALALTESGDNPTERAHTLHGLGLIHDAQGEIEQALKCHEQSLTIFEQVGDISGIIVSLNHLGNIYLHQRDFEQALNYYEQALVVSEQARDPINTAISLARLGSLFVSVGDWEQALNYHEQALALFEQIHNPIKIASSLSAIGDIYDRQGKLEQALNYYEQALSLYEQLRNPDKMASTLSFIARINEQQGKFEQALRYYQQGLDLAEQINDPNGIIYFLNGIGMIYNQQKEFEQALSYFQRALVLVGQINNLPGLATALNNIGFVHLQQKEFEQALNYFQRALHFAEQANNIFYIASSLKNIGAVYCQQKKWERAIERYSRALDLFKHLGAGFESKVVDQLEKLAMCYEELGEYETSLAYRERATQIGEGIQRTS